MRAQAAVVYQDPDGWSLEVLEQIPYTEIGEWTDRQGVIDYFGGLMGFEPGYALHRAMAKDPADYYRCILRVDCPAQLELGPDSVILVYNDNGGCAATERILLMDGLGQDQHRVFDTSRERVSICGNRELQWLKHGQDRGLPVALHFPPGSTNGVDHIARLEFREGGETPCVEERASLPLLRSLR